MRSLYIISFIILIIYAIIGLLFVGTIFHESYHKWDMKDIPKSGEEEICLLRYPSFHGDYTLITNKEGSKLFEEKKFKSEAVAYSIDGIFILPLLFAITVIMREGWDWKDE